jgi:hypothetical protein
VDIVLIILLYAVLEDVYRQNESIVHFSIGESLKGLYWMKRAESGEYNAVCVFFAIFDFCLMKVQNGF